MKARVARKVIEAIIRDDGEPSDRAGRFGTFHAACCRLRKWVSDESGAAFLEEPIEAALRITEAKTARCAARAALRPRRKSR